MLKKLQVLTEDIERIEIREIRIVFGKLVISKLYNCFSQSFLQLFIIHLSNREQYVTLNCFRSSKYTLFSDVPQGSVLGPLLFNTFSDIGGSFNTEYLLFVVSG